MNPFITALLYFSIGFIISALASEKQIRELRQNRDNLAKFITTYHQKGD